MTSAVKTFMERYYQTYNRADPQALAAFYHPEVRLLSAQGEMLGRESVLSTYSYIIERFEDRMTPLSMTAEGDRVAVEIRDEFTARAEVPDFLGRSFAAGERFTLNLCGIYQLDGEQIGSVVLYQR